MASDTSLVFNLIARDRASGTMDQVAERFNTSAMAIGAGVGVALGVGITNSLNVEAANDKLAAQLGMGPAEAAAVAKVSASVYQNAWGDSTETVNLAIKGVYQNIGDVSQAEGGLEGVTTKALALSQTFDQDLTMATAAVGQLMRTGLAKNADEAFDIITTGLQSSADKSGDYLETLNEYSTQWRRVGLSGKTATGLLSQALKAGARDADQVADAIGQFGERALAGGKPVDEAFKSIGLNATTMAKMIGAGGTQAEKALQMTMDGLRKTGNEQTKLNAAAALFGDPGNVMGASLFALDPATAAAAAGMDNATGATDRLVAKMGGSGAAALEEFKRTALGKLTEVSGGFIEFAMRNQAVFVPLTYTLAGLAATVLLVRGAMMTYSAVSAVVAGANAIISASTWTVMGNWLRMMGIGLMVYLRIAAGAVVSGITTAAAWTGAALASIGTWIAAVVTAGATAAVQFALMSGRAIVWAATMAAQWLIAMGPIGWIIAAVIGLVALIITYWDEIKSFTVGAWNAIWGYVKEITIRKISEFMVMVGALPDKVKAIFMGAGQWLYSAGKDIVMGIWNGIQGMGGWLRSTLIGWAKNMIPGPILKALGIASPSKLFADEVGQWIPAGIVLGIEARQGDLDKTMAGLVTPPASGLATAAGQSMAGGGAGPLMRPGYGPQQVRVVLDVRGGESELTRFFRKAVRVVGQGDVQTAFGQ
ncbi:phage tail tape measure protein [Streptomyces antarcticus]|uniref:phage tail tape measure protein n=1 Tax=Streptomyces antarcticus TaxID=2996458 RepID=UPI0022721398|nr:MULTISPECIES: phage tail tape measure protein [unclassified Streptomyces]MCY0943531.1 phage tail tape measure protein [Streptomyces sp. H34-AA3]MCZ4083560.1 phage tail tape measure protein [Streptomyces sp. H34-S5]